MLSESCRGGGGLLDSSLEIDSASVSLSKVLVADASSLATLS